MGPIRNFCRVSKYWLLTLSLNSWTKACSFNGAIRIVAEHVDFNTNLIKLACISWCTFNFGGVARRSHAWIAADLTLCTSQSHSSTAKEVGISVKHWIPVQTYGKTSKCHNFNSSQGVNQWSLPNSEFWLIHYVFPYSIRFDATKSTLKINSHEINSREINSHKINFSWDQFPYDQPKL